MLPIEENIDFGISWLMPAHQLCFYLPNYDDKKTIRNVVTARHIYQNIFLKIIVATLTLNMKRNYYDDPKSKDVKRIRKM